MRRRTSALVRFGAAAAAAALLPLSAGALTTAVAERQVVNAAEGRCRVSVGAFTPSSDHLIRMLVASEPPAAFPDEVVMRDVHPDGAVVMAARANPYPSGDPERISVHQWLVLGDVLHHAVYEITDGGTLAPGDPRLTRIGGGWGAMRAMEVSGSALEPPASTKLYALGKDGSLHRWARSGAGWTRKQSVPGFRSVKAITLVSHDTTSDTFLMTTTGGALYSVRIPFTSPLAPVVQQVRTRSWQGFESLAAQPCGWFGTVLAGIDRDTGDTHLYAVGALRGAGTVVEGLGRAPARTTERVTFTWGGSPLGF